MMRTAMISLLALAACDAPARDVTFEERYRPLYHFTPDRNWMNDPNGLVFYEGEYHLFFQHNPRGDRWGHLSWGHAVSTDLVNWRQMPLALPERDVMIFSGSTVIDTQNSSGFGRDGAPPMVAIYTGYNPRNHVENQQLSFSLDRGRSWRDYENNPVLEGRAGMFRDPKVFWHEPTQRWIMTVSRADSVLFFASQNLREWIHLSTFGPAGEVDGPWEVPELMQVPVDGGGARWVLTVGVTGHAGVAGGSGVQYFVGEFDGERFVPDGGERVGATRWVDYGADFYAAQSWSGLPQSDGRRIWIAWMANTSYANEQPTRPWRGALTIPRTLYLMREGDAYTLAQRPIRELEQLRRVQATIAPREVAAGAAPLPELASLGEGLEIDLKFRVDQAGAAGLILHFGRSEVRVGYDARNGTVFVDRRRGGRFNAEGFAALHAAPLSASDGVVTLRIFLDRSSIEVFAQDGARVITDLLFPEDPFSGASFYAEAAGADIVHLNAWALAAMDRGAAQAK